MGCSDALFSINALPSAAHCLCSCQPLVAPGCRSKPTSAVCFILGKISTCLDQINGSHVLYENLPCACGTLWIQVLLLFINRMDGQIVLCNSPPPPNFSRNLCSLTWSRVLCLSCGLVLILHYHGREKRASRSVTGIKPCRAHRDTHHSFLHVLQVMQPTLGPKGGNCRVCL